MTTIDQAMKAIGSQVGAAFGRVIAMTAIGVQAGLSDQQIRNAINSHISIAAFACQHGVTELNTRIANGVEILGKALMKDSKP